MEGIIFNRDYTYKTICATDTAISPTAGLSSRYNIEKRARAEREVGGAGRNRIARRRGGEKVILQASGYAEGAKWAISRDVRATPRIYTISVDTHVAPRTRAAIVNVTRKRWCFVVYFGL